MRLLGSAATFAPTLVVCYAISFVVHVGSVTLSTLLPFHMLDVGGSRTQVGLLFSISALVAMVLRPTVGGWVDRFGARLVITPGVVILLVTSLAFHVATTPAALIVLMIGIGLSNGLVSTPASVLTATSSAPAHRGEALGTYYLASSLAIAISPPLAFGLRAVGGMTLEFVCVSLVALVLAVLVARLPHMTPAPQAVVTRPGLRFVSGRALPVSGALVLATLGHSSVYAFLPLYAVSRGRGATLAWFFVVYPLWLIACRAALRGISDRLGHARVGVIAMALQALGFVIIAFPPTVLSLVLGAVALATGGAVLYPTLVALVIERADQAERGLALGTLSGSWDLGVVIGSALVGVVADQVSYGAGFAVGALGCVLGVLALALIEWRGDMVPNARRRRDASTVGV
jgi:MFS family permease